ncbi:unnamed protein product [Blepharisma stoltei]|uniref:Uncharacterized protein n=1 Tax=Blepharisma stoltei TaxID=1481888 RepID=A0AAU9JX07_9CILI|nr:unnamed protein product [Blepharisma stoltei]
MKGSLIKGGNNPQFLSQFNRTRSNKPPLGRTLIITESLPKNHYLYSSNSSKTDFNGTAENSSLKTLTDADNFSEVLNIKKCSSSCSTINFNSKVAHIPKINKPKLLFKHLVPIRALSISPKSKENKENNKIPNIKNSKSTRPITHLWDKWEYGENDKDYDLKEYVNRMLN